MGSQGERIYSGLLNQTGTLPIGECKYYVFYSDKILSKTTGEFLSIYFRSYQGGNFSQVKKYETTNGQIRPGTTSLRYPLTEETINNYLTESRMPTCHQG